MTELTHGTLYEAALTVSGTDEDGVDGQKDPASLGEKDGGEENPEPQSELERGDQGHAGIIVLLHETTNGIGQGRCLCSGPTS